MSVEAARNAYNKVLGSRGMRRWTMHGIRILQPLSESRFPETTKFHPETATRADTLSLANAASRADT